MPRDEADLCLDELRFMSVMTFACGHHIEFHSVAQPMAEDFEGVDKAPCPWCIAKEQMPDRTELHDLHHFHVPGGYHRGDAAFKRSALSPEQALALRQLEGEFSGPTTD